MRLKIERQRLLQQVQRCQNIVEKRNTKPILCNLFLKAESNHLEIIGTDLQIAIAGITEAQVIEEGETTVSAQKFFNIIKELDLNQPVELMLKDAFLTIKSGNSRFRLSTLPIDDFPGMPDDDTEMTFDMDTQLLSKMIQCTAFAMSTDETRKYLTGTLFETKSDAGFRLIATDTHRLNFVDLEMSAMNHDIQAIVPRKTVIEMRKIADEQKGLIQISLGKRQIRLHHEACTLSSKIIDATFPAYQDVIPRENPYQVNVNCKELDQALRRCMIVANEITHDLCVHLTKEGLNIAAHNVEQEQCEEFVKADGATQDIMIGFNGKYLRDVLSVLSSDEISINYRDELSPVLLEPVGPQNEKYIVMPMRI